MGRIFRFIGLGCLGALAAVGLATLIVVGVAAGVFWYISRSPDLRVSFTFPIEGRQATVDITNDASRLGKEIERMVGEGKIQAQVDITGPGGIKLLGIRSNADIPLDRIANQLMGQFLGGGAGGLGGISPQDLQRFLGGGGGAAPQGLPPTPAPAVTSPPGQPTPTPLPPLTTESILRLTPQERLGLAPQLLGENAGKTLPQILSTTSEEELKNNLGANYKEVLAGIFAGKGDKTLGQVFAEDPTRLLPLLLGGAH
ncbi:MAG: hypothetical protein HY687_01565 [Chloroflexi bacterium]|nr:hypothetical protein [Chloroflexota bacterium]